MITIQYNVMHKFVRVLDSPPFLSVVPLSLRVLEVHCFVSLLLEMVMPSRGELEPKAQTVGAYPGFISMKHPGVLLLPPPLDGMLVHHRVTP